MELGIYTFGDRRRDPSSGTLQPAASRLRELVVEARAAEEAGLDVLGVGEHHRDEYAISSPATALAAAAGVTERLRLTSAVTVLSSDDPVRVFQQFASLDGLSGGRAEIMVGRGSFIESFPLFGFDTADYDDLFAEKLELLLALRSGEPVTWQGRHRAPLAGAVVRPAPVQTPLPLWIAVGGNPPSVARAGLLGLPMALAIIGGQPARMAPLAELHARALSEGGHGPQPISLNMHGFVAETAREAADAYAPHWAEVMTQLGRERGWPPATRPQFDQAMRPEGHLLVGDPEMVAQKILALHDVFGHARHLVQMDVGGVPHDAVLRSIELFGREVAPRVAAGLAARGEPTGVGSR